MTPARRTRAIGLTALVAGACTPEAASSEGAAVADLYRFFLYVAAVIFVVVAGLIAWNIVAYRDKGERDLPPQIHANVPLEILWFAIPTVIVIVLFIVSANVTGDVNATNDPTDPEVVTIEVTGFQWGWRFTYEGGGSVISLPETKPDIVVPVDTPVTFLLNSDDVIHSFYVPRFLIKRDVIPGRTNRIDLVIEDEGSYGGVCAEFCGLLHDSMDFTIEAVPRAEFDTWLDELSEGAGR